MEDMAYEYWFACVRPLADKKKRKLREIYGSGRAVYYIEEKKLTQQSILSEKELRVVGKAKQEVNPEESYRKLAKKGISFVPYFHKDYPKKLAKYKDAPYAIYVKGKLPDEEKISAAIVGARRCTPYGEAMALEYGEVFARAGVEVISGMAKGIDGAGQRGTLNGGGTTYAVLGCGVDVCYPREHLGLYMDIQKAGGIISEQPPGEPPLPAYFPQRNRIISGLSDVILVMEAKERSGSLITADLGLEQGKDVYALPGPATSPMSYGCHKLIQQGAGILLSPEELLEELSIQIRKLCKKTDKNKKVLETPENIVYSCLDLFPKSVSELLEHTEYAPKELLQILSTLEIKGLIKEVSKNYYIKVRK